MHKFDINIKNIIVSNVHYFHPEKQFNAEMQDEGCVPSKSVANQVRRSKEDIEALLVHPDEEQRRWGIIHAWDPSHMDLVPLLHAITRNDPVEEVRSCAASTLSMLSDDIRHHSLYAREDDVFFDPSRNIVRKKFVKKGYESETVLLGGTLTGKAIVRVIDASCFRAWKLAFEARAEWEAAGFDYVPIEPIASDRHGELRATPDRQGRYRVVCGVLGKSASHFMAAHPESRTEIERQRSRILAVLFRLGVDHGDIENFSNFCVQEESGCIRLFLIDFDKARSAGDVPESYDVRRGR